MADLGISRARKAIRRELRYVRGQLAGLTERGSHQRFEVRQIAKATLAAVLAWLLADRLLPRETVWIAPATAVIMVHATVYKTLTNGVRRVSAVAAGVILAGSVGHLLGLTALSLILVVPPALVAARWHRMGRHGSDVATTAVLMLSFGAASQERYLLAYVVATGVGAVVGALVNAILWPPLYRRGPYSAVRRLSRETAELLGQVADGLREDCDLSALPEWERRAGRLDTHREQAAAAVADGAESRRYNLRHVGDPAPDSHASLLEAMEQIGVHVHAIVRALGHVVQQDAASSSSRISGEFARDYAGLLDLLAEVISNRVRHPDDSTGTGVLITEARRQAGAIQGQMTAEVRAGRLDHPEGWAASGSLLTDAERILSILAKVFTDDEHAPASTP